MFINSFLKKTFLILLCVNSAYSCFIKIPIKELPLTINNHQATVPDYIQNHQKIKCLYPQEQQAFKEEFKKERIEVIAETIKLADIMIKGSDYLNPNYDVTNKLRDVKKLEDLRTIIEEKKQVTLKKELKVLLSKNYSKENLYKSYEKLLLNTNDIDPLYSDDMPHTIKNNFKTLLHAIKLTEPKIPIISIITSEGTDPLSMPGATGPNSSHRAYKILLSPELPENEAFFILSHELGHLLNLHSHLIYDAHKNMHYDSLIRKIWNHKKIYPALASLKRVCELEADTHLITTLPPELAEKITISGIETMVNRIAFNTILYKKDPYMHIKEDLTHRNTEANHPTFPFRLLWLFKAYEISSKLIK